MIKVAFQGYRKWALQIFLNLVDLNNSLEEPFFKLTSSLEADVILYYGWSSMIPAEEYEKKLCLILHPSPLPKYRGGSPLQHQIIAGEKESAVTILKVGKELDAGEVYAQTTFPLDGSLDEVFRRMTDLGTRLTIGVLQDYSLGKLKGVKQDESKATSYKRRTPDQSEITVKDFKHKTAEELYNFIRALSFPYPNAFIKCKDGKKLYITGSH